MNKGVKIKTHNCRNEYNIKAFSFIFMLFCLFLFLIKIFIYMLDINCAFFAYFLYLIS